MLYLNVVEKSLQIVSGQKCKASIAVGSLPLYISERLSVGLYQMWLKIATVHYNPSSTNMLKRNLGKLSVVNK